METKLMFSPNQNVVNVLQKLKSLNNIRYTRWNIKFGQRLELYKYLKTSFYSYVRRLQGFIHLLQRCEIRQIDGHVQFNCIAYF